MALGIDAKTAREIRAQVAADRAAILKSVRSIRSIAEEVATEFGIHIALLITERRQPDIVRARHAAMYRASEAGHTLGVIGLFFARDQSSVSWSIRAHKERSSPLSSPLTAKNAHPPVELSEPHETIGS